MNITDEVILKMTNRQQTSKVMFIKHDCFGIFSVSASQNT